jgi:hypothetical protein
MANAADKQLADLAVEKETLNKQIRSKQDRISVIEKMESALGGSASPKPAVVPPVKNP